MGFLSYNLNYYNHQLLELENSKVTKEKIYHAKLLLKLLDDLKDEGYEELNNQIEQCFKGVSRLRNYIMQNHEKPFTSSSKPIYDHSLTYSKDECELNSSINELIIKAKESKDITNNDFIKELTNFCEWIGYDEDTAYIFLLRDTLLPYIYYQTKERTNINPWLLGRKCLNMLAEKENVDDEIRASIYQTLENKNCCDFKSFSKEVILSIRETLNKYPQIGTTLLELLGKIKEKHIIVVESGCSGTFPMLLMCLDMRVDIRMYTTYPYLFGIFDDRIYTSKYENNRLFETLYSQDLYFQFSNIKNGYFFVKKCKNYNIEKRTFSEVKTIIEKAR